MAMSTKNYSKIKFKLLDTPECMSNLNRGINQWHVATRNSLLSLPVGPNDFIPFVMFIVVVVVFLIVLDTLVPYILVTAIQCGGRRILIKPNNFEILKYF